MTALVPVAENHVSGTAYRPGDMIRHVGGRISEVLNTDAEGRLVLADTLAYAVARLAPDLLVDVATLTGAMKIALGTRTAGFFATDEPLAAALVEAAGAAGESLWRMPLVEDYTALLHSEVADAVNAPGGGSAGAITAAPFSGRSSAPCPGRTWTSPARPVAAPTTTSSRAGPPASACAPCCADWRRSARPANS